MVDYEATPRLPRINIDYPTPEREETGYHSYDAIDMGTSAAALGKDKAGSDATSDVHYSNSLIKSQVIILDSPTTTTSKSSSLSNRNSTKTGRPVAHVSIHSRKCSRQLSNGSDEKPHSGFSLPSRYSCASQKPSMKSARSAERTFLSYDLPPMSNSAKSRSSARRSISDHLAMDSPYRLDLVESEPNSNKPTREPTPETSRRWQGPELSSSRYNEMKARLLQEGKFKERLTTYFRLEPKWWEDAQDSEDDGYDTDLDKQLGFELIADEKSREILEDGVYPEYKHDCRKFRSNPNSYFLRNCLEDDLRMRHRYLSKGDSITISNHIKNHLTMSDIDLADNGIGPRGMKYFKNVLRTNKHLAVLNLASNNLGQLGAKYLRSSLVSNCFLQKLDVSDNHFGEKGAKYISEIVEENVNLKDLNLSRNEIGDNGITLISKALGRNISLKVLDISWNHISPKGAVKVADGLKKNSELEVLLAAMNGFGEEGGRAVVSAVRHNPVLHVLDLSFNRLTDPVLKLVTAGLDTLALTDLQVAYNSFTTKAILDLLTAIMAMTSPISYIDLEGIHVTDQLKGLANALHVVHNIDVDFTEPPSQRETTTDVLTRNLITISEFMEDEEVEVEDLFPDYEELGCMREEGQDMLTTKEVLCALEICGRVTRQDKLRRLASRLERGKTRKFSVSELGLVFDQVICGKDPLREITLGIDYVKVELGLVFDQVICGKDPLREMPLRTHLRRSIKEERAEKERKAQQANKKKYSSVLSAPAPKKKS